MTQLPTMNSSRSTVSSAAPPLYLRSIGGPITAELRAVPGRSNILGRDEAANLRTDDPTVSRQHSRLSVLGGQWTITDLGSHNGTILCGQRLEAHRPTPLRIGDEIRIGQCTFQVFGSQQPRELSGLALTDAGGGRVATHGEGELGPGNLNQMRRLADVAVALGACATLREVAARTVEELLAGTGLENAVFVEATPDLSEARAIVSRSRRGPQAGPIQISRSLLAAALRITDGRKVVTLGDQPDQKWGASIMALDIVSATAAPVIADGRMLGVLYGDVRGSHKRGAASGNADASFVLGLAHVCAVAGSRVQNAEIRRRMESVDRELKAARRAQRAFLPPAEGRVGGVRYKSSFIPGAHVAGDFFDVVAMPDGRIACLLGDVCGHGMAAGLFMASLRTHIRDQLGRGATLAVAMDSANRLMATLNDSCEPAGSAVFATLFAAAIDAANHRMECIDCGHGYAAIVRGGDARAAEVIAAGSGLPLGIDAGQTSQPVDLAIAPGDAMFLFSDGVVEQPGAADGSQFGIARVLESLSGAGNMAQRSAALHLALTRHAGIEQTGAFQDDVTVLGVVIATE